MQLRNISIQAELQMVINHAYRLLEADGNTSIAFFRYFARIPNIMLIVDSQCECTNTLIHQSLSRLPIQSHILARYINSLANNNNVSRETYQIACFTRRVRRRLEKDREKQRKSRTEIHQLAMICML